MEQALLGPRRLGVDFELQVYDLFLQVSDDSVVICCLGHEMRFGWVRDFDVVHLREEKGVRACELLLCNIHSCDGRLGCEVRSDGSTANANSNTEV